MQQAVVGFCVITTMGHAERLCSEGEKKKEECNVNEDYWSTCDSLNSSGFVLSTRWNYKVTLLKDFLSLYHMPSCDTV